MDYEKTVSLIANAAAILTALIAAFGYGRYIYDQWDRRRRLEQYLCEEKEIAFDEGGRTILHLMGHLSMTESEVISAAFRSKKISSSLSVNWQGQAQTLLFKYIGNGVHSS